MKNKEFTKKQSHLPKKAPDCAENPCITLCITMYNEIEIKGNIRK